METQNIVEDHLDIDDGTTFAVDRTKHIRIGENSDLIIDVLACCDQNIIIKKLTSFVCYPSRRIFKKILNKKYPMYAFWFYAVLKL